MKMPATLLSTAIIGIVALAGCASRSALDASSSAVEVTRSLPPPSQTEPMVDFTNYRIGPLDKITVEVFGARELAREGAVDGAGNFAMPLVGVVAAGGKTPAELSQAIADRLRGKYVKHPQVSVNTIEARAQTFTVDGSVNSPGLFPIIGRMTLQQGLAVAKGASKLSDLNKIIIFRTANGQKMAAMFNLKDIRAGRYADPQIYKDDIIVVGENSTRRFLKDFSATIPMLGAFSPLGRSTGAATVVH